jgi:hypothetical protein
MSITEIFKEVVSTRRSIYYERKNKIIDEKHEGMEGVIMR